MIIIIVLPVDIIIINAKNYEALSNQWLGSSVITTNDDTLFCTLTKNY